MSDIRFEGWLHRSGTGGVYQDSAGNVGIASTQPKTSLDIQNGAFQVGPAGICTVTSVNVGTAATIHANGNVTCGIITTTNIVNSTPLSHRNIVINGDMRVAQRSTSESMSDSGNDMPTCDRWNYSRNGVTATVAQVAEAPDGTGLTHSLKWTSTSAVGSIAAGNTLIYLYKIETQDIKRLGYGASSAKTATLSFYAKGSLAGKIGVNCRRDSKIFSANVDMTANTWQRHTIVIPADTSTGFSANDADNGWQFGITWGAGSNSTSGTTGGNWINFHNAYTAGFTAGQQGAYLTTSGSTFQITGVQLEVGSVATPFEHRSYADELRRCKRYYHLWVEGANQFVCFGDFFTGGQCDGGVQLPVEMRATPSLDVNTGADYYIIYTNSTQSHIDGNFNIFKAHKRAVLWYAAPDTNRTAGHANRWITNNASAKIAFDAEL